MSEDICHEAEFLPGEKFEGVIRPDFFGIGIGIGMPVGLSKQSMRFEGGKPTGYRYLLSVRPAMTEPP